MIKLVLFGIMSNYDVKGFMSAFVEATEYRLPSMLQVPYESGVLSESGVYVEILQEEGFAQVVKFILKK